MSAPGERSPVGEEPGDGLRPGGGDRGLAYERTVLAWTRTALSFGAVGGVIAKSHVLPGLVIMCLAPVVWQVGRLTRKNPLPGRIKLITGTVVLVSVTALVLALLSGG